MNRAIDQFHINIGTVKHLGVMYATFASQLTPAVDLSDILRAEIVLAVSALDCFVHDMVRIGMSKIFERSGGEPQAFLNFNISVQSVKEIIDAVPTDKKYYFEKEIRRLHGYRTFQSSENISQALSFIGIRSIWNKVGDSLSVPSDDVRNHLDVIVNRRNKIAHESDIDPALNLGTRYPIDSAWVNDSIDFLEKIVHSIYSITVNEIGP